MITIKPDQLYEYDPNYSRAYHRFGRFVVQRMLHKGAGTKAQPLDMWECFELASGDTRNYDENQIFDVGNLLQIQPGSTWSWVGTGNVSRAEHTIKLVSCRRGAAGFWLWEIVRDNGDSDLLGEDLLLDWYARVDGPQLAAGRDRSKSNTSCPLCGAAAFRLFTAVECPNNTCKNFR